MAHILKNIDGSPITAEDLQSEFRDRSQETSEAIATVDQLFETDREDKRAELLSELHEQLQQLIDNLDDFCAYCKEQCEGPDDV